MDNKPTQSFQCIYYNAGHFSPVNNEIILEMPISLTINGDLWLSIMCTPIDLEAMAIGFLFNEGFIDSVQELETIQLCASGDNIDIWLNHTLKKPVTWGRTSGCMGGMTFLDYDYQSIVIKNDYEISEKSIGLLINLLYKSQQFYRVVGGIHTSALSDGHQIILSCEDIGRHNTLDKISGRLLIEDIRDNKNVIITTGRISSEMLQKVARIGVPVIISRTSPSSLSIELAIKWGITLIGYARRNQYIIYSHPERIIKSTIN